MDRRSFLQGLLAGATALSSTSRASAADTSDLGPLRAEIEKHHDESVQRLQEWIHQPWPRAAS
jgi:hypothetical protein